MVAGQQELPDTDILLHGTKIEQVGAGLVAPAGAQVIDAQHRVCTPGIVDMYVGCVLTQPNIECSRHLLCRPAGACRHSHAGVYGWPEVWAREDGNEMTNPAFPQVRAIDAYDPIDSAIPLILGGGVTTSQILPGSGNTMGGEGFIVKMRGHTVRDAYYPGSPRFLKHALGENPKVCAATLALPLAVPRALIAALPCGCGCGCDTTACVRVGPVVPLVAARMLVTSSSSPPLWRCLRRSKDVTPMSRMGSAWIMRQKYEQAAKLIAAQEAWCLDPHTRRGADRADE